jgi:hypothetical protein
MADIRRCKFGCDTQLRDFDEKENKYKEHPSGIIHTRERCTEAKRKKEQNQNQPAPQQQNNNQDQKSLDIKAAQLERKRQHDELIKNLQWNTRMLAHLNETQGGKMARDILEEMGFEEFEEEQRSYENNVI